MNKPAENPSCPYCLNAIEDNQEKVICPKCGVSHHAECWQANGRCSIDGCDGWTVWNKDIANGIAEQADASPTPPAQPAAPEVVRCIKCGTPVDPGKLICFECKRKQPKHYLENCSGPSIILLGVIIGVTTLIVRALT